jgi:hypothetical protein
VCRIGFQLVSCASQNFLIRFSANFFQITESFRSNYFQVVQQRTGLSGLNLSYQCSAKVKSHKPILLRSA